MHIFSRLFAKGALAIPFSVTIAVISSAVKTAIKKFNKALESKDEAAIEEAYTAAVSKVDKAVTKGVIHKNAANRKKAQLAKKHDAK